MGLSNNKARGGKGTLNKVVVPTFAAALAAAEDNDVACGEYGESIEKLQEREPKFYTRREHAMLNDCSLSKITDILHKLKPAGLVEMEERFVLSIHGAKRRVPFYRFLDKPKVAK